MADYKDLHDKFNDSALRNRIEVAIVVEAHGLAVSVSPTAEQLSWVGKALGSPRGEAEKALMFVLAANKGLTITEIDQALDPALQTQVALVIPALVAAG
jgi:hypothetical protein